MLAKGTEAPVSRLTLTHLTFIGGSVAPASVEFGSHATIIRGPSDTGKSFIVDAIDFMFGASALKEIPERTGYSTVLLGLALPDGEEVTLSRSVAGGALGLYHADLRSGPLGVPDETLAAKHDARSEANLSRYLLRQTALDGARVRKNVRNETDSLSFRNLAHLCIVDETQMQAETPPALTGQYTSKTKEVSILKLLLEDEDDSAVVAVDSKEDAKKLSGAKVDVLERLIEAIEAQTGNLAEPADLRAQLARLDAAVEEHARAVSGVSEERSRVLEASRAVQTELARFRTEIGDAVALRSRFELLQRQYESDLERLAMVGEAGNLLGYFRSGVCVFCGAEPQHQHYNEACEGESTSFGASVEAERRRTSALRTDLLATLADVGTRLAELRALADGCRAQAEDLAGDLRRLDGEVSPLHHDLTALVNARGEAERSLSLYEQLATLERMKTEVAAEAKVEVAAAGAAIGFAAIREFSAELSQRLAAWGYPEAGSVRYDRAAQDIVAGDQFRSAHGKGVRAILHAAFTLSLGQYCLDREIPHPGFVVLDSPLVTYRPPAPGEVKDVEAELPEGVVAAFYRNIQEQFDGQVIVMENTDPPIAVNPETVDIVFTKAAGVGRYGYFPHRPSAGGVSD